MSTTFQVFPTHTDYPTYGRVRDLSLVRLNEFLARHGAARSIESIRIVWLDGTDDPAEVDYDVIWEKDSHPRMWFYIGSDIVGWCDTDCFSYDDPDLGYDALDEWADQLDPETREKARKADRCFGTYRSMGAPALWSIGYGVVAAVFAELTDGFICSSDSAAPSIDFPCDPAEFLSQWASETDPGEGGYWALLWSKVRDGSAFKHVE